MKVIYNLLTSAVLPYPRQDEDPVIGLDLETYMVLDKIDVPQPPTTVLEIATFTYIVDLAKAEFKQTWTVTIKPADTLANWQGFLDDLDVPELGGKGLFAIGITADRDLFLSLYQLLLRLEDDRAPANNTAKEWRTFCFLYSMAVGVFNPEQVAMLEDSLTENNIPIPNK